MSDLKRLISMIVAIWVAFLVSVMPVQASKQIAQPSGGIELPDDNWECPFKDVETSDYFYEPVLWAVEKKITSGTSSTAFSPDATCTRAQVVTFLWRAFGSPNPKSSASHFTDVKSDSYYFKAVLWAVEKGITAGTSKTTFSPEESCTRGQVVTLLWRAMGKPNAITNRNPFTDVASDDYFYDPVRWAVENNITAGTSKRQFSPDSDCTRGQVVTFLYRTLFED